MQQARLHIACLNKIFLLLKNYDRLKLYQLPVFKAEKMK